MQVSRQTASNRKAIKWLKDAWFLAKPYWTSEDKWQGIGLFTLVIIFNLLTVYMTVISNNWFNGFYNAIQRYDKTAFYKYLISFSYIAFFYIAFQVLASYFRKFLRIRWRRWMTANYINAWLDNQAYYKSRFLNIYSDNPDQRISADIDSYIYLTLDLTLGVLTSAVSLASFIIVLWRISGVLQFNLAGYQVVITGYMVWAALLYAIVGTWITFKIGRPLIRLDFQEQAVEADFRFSLMRVREYGENIAFYQGEKQEKDHLKYRFNALVNNFIALIYRSMKIDIFNVGYNQLAVVFPFVVSMPRYLARAIKLGDLMQISSAFGRVQDAFSYFLNSYNSLAGWRATMDRLFGFQDIIAKAGNLNVLGKEPNPDSVLTLKDLNLYLPDNRLLVEGINFSVNAGERLLIRGRSGSGKTTFLRSLAGLWPYAQGRIFLEEGKHEFFIAQRPYIPYGSLRQAVCYPLINSLPTKKVIEEILWLCKLGYLVERIDEIKDWGKILSLGEQQRIAFGRILINKPDIVYLDEATSAVDEETERELYQLLVTHLPQTTVISVGHRSTLQQWHTQEINFSQRV